VWALASQLGYIHDFNMFGNNLIITEEDAFGVGAS
jgi:hypothetical protein